ncbi:MAG: hypothetical protein ACLTAN_08480 [Christensenellaceae bacterium]|jgi:hypothetical protein
MNDKEKTLQIETGVFWICFKGENADFICDKGRFVKCGGKRIVEKITKDEDGLNYKYSHKKAWEELSKTAAEGRYAEYAFNDFPRGRIWFDIEERRHYVMYDEKLSPAAKIVEEEIKKNFHLIDPEFMTDLMLYKSRIQPEIAVIKRVFGGK